MPGRWRSTTRRAIRNSPIARRRVRRSTIRWPACRSCAPVACWACWSCRTARAATTTRKRSRRCRPSPWCWRRWSRPVTSSAPTRSQQVDGLGLLPLRIDGVQLTPGVAIGHAVLHEPRIVIQRVVAEDVGRRAEALRGGAGRACATMSIACSRRTTCSRASSARSSRPSACSSTIAAGSSACARRSVRVSPPRRACSAPSTTCARGSANRPIPTSASG